MKRAIKSTANAAIDKAIDPEKEIDMVILELEEQRKLAYKELLGYKTTAKQMERDMEELEAKAQKWEKRAVTAVKAGDDETARQCLKEQREALAERDRVRRDRDEAAGYAIELNNSRKKVEHRLKVLKLKKGTMATQIATARSKSGSTFGETNELFEKFEAAGEAIDDEAIAAEVQAAMEGEATGSELESKLLSLEGGAGATGEADDELTRLKARMLEQKKERERKLLEAGDKPGAKDPAE
jgi:phage shock protein A